MRHRSLKIRSYQPAGPAKVLSALAKVGNAQALAAAQA